MKKIVASLLTIIMLCGLLTGCGGSKKDEVEGGKLVVGIPQKISVTDYEENAFTKYLEENTGVKIEFMFFSSLPANISNSWRLWLQVEKNSRMY